MTRQPFRFLLLSGGLLALAFGGAATAQKQPALAPPPKAAEPDDSKAKKTTGRVLTTESLADMLDSMGYDYRTETLPSGGSIYTVMIQTDTWKFVVEVSLAPNGSLVWLGAPLYPLPPAGTVPPEPLVRLFQENWSIYPHVFACPKDSRRLYLQRAIENQNMTPAKLRAGIDAMTGTIRSTAPLWDVPKWGQTTTPDTKKTPDGGTAAYPDTPEGLTKLCNELVAAGKAGKRAEVAAKAKGLVLPNHDAWFKRVFGPDTGAALAEEYTAGLPQLEANVTRWFMTAGEEGQTDIKVFKFARPDAENATAAQTKIMEAMVVKTPLYSVYLSQPGEETGMHLYSFVYVDGAFRLAGKMKAVTARASGFRGLNGFEFLSPPANGQPEPNPLAPVFNGPIVRDTPLGFSGPTTPTPTVNRLDPADFRHLTPLHAAGNTTTGFAALGALIPPTKQPPEGDEPSVEGTWTGELTAATQRWKVTSTYRANGTYRTVMEYRSYVITDRGTYTYADGILKTEPEGGIPGTFVVTFVDNNTMKLKGGGFTITFKRQ